MTAVIAALAKFRLIDEAKLKAVASEGTTLSVPSGSLIVISDIVDSLGADNRHEA